MSLYVLDTDILSLYQHGHPEVCRLVSSHSLAEMANPVISIEEQISGWYTLLRRATKRDQIALVYRRLAITIPFLARWPILDFTEPAIVRYEDLLSLKLNIKKMDLRIAAITLENAGTLVTRNRRDFQRVPSLVIEDWSVSLPWNKLRRLRVIGLAGHFTYLSNRLTISAIFCPPKPKLLLKTCRTRVSRASLGM